MKHFTEIGSAPADEDCAQVGDEDYDLKAWAECSKFKDLIREKIGPAPDGAKLVIKTQHHDFGDYYEVCVRYDDEKRESINYAFRVETEAPTRWKENT